jgi:hypothetical protein
MFPNRKALSVVLSLLFFFGAAFSANGAGNDTRLSNISTRAPVGSGDNVLIAGFIVTGTQPKKVMICGMGPSLGAVGVQGALTDPRLELHQGSSMLASNDDWKLKPDGSSQWAEIEATTLEPYDDRESALIATLNPGAYTAILAGKSQTAGIGVVEVYDLDPTANSRLANISTRGSVSTGDNAMIAGTIIAGAASQKVLIRAVGPSLSLPGKLGDPTLELRDANGGLLGANDNWGNSPDRQTIIDSTLAPSDPLESAMVATLPANNSTYTAIVRGVAVTDSWSVTQLQFGSGNTPEIQRVQLARAPTGGSFLLTILRPRPHIVAGQPGDKAALEDIIGIPWNATADEIKAQIMASFKFFKYDQNNHLTAGPAGFDFLFDSGGGLGIEGNEGFRREPVVTGSAANFTIQFGTLTTGPVGTRNTWIIGLPLVQIDDSSINYGDTGIAVVEVYALP